MKGMKKLRQWLTLAITNVEKKNRAHQNRHKDKQTTDKFLKKSSKEYEKNIVMDATFGQ